MLTRDLVEEALDIIVPAIEARMKDGPVPCESLHIVVADPAVKPAEHDFTSAPILGERSIGPPTDGDQAEAVSLVTIAWREELPSGLVRARRPFLIRRGETLNWGSVHLEGISVGVYGEKMPSYFCEMFAYWVAATVLGLAKHRGEDPPTDEHGRLSA